MASFSLGLPAQPLTQDPALYPELVRIYNALRTLSRELDSRTGQPIVVIAGENLSYGHTVGIKADGKAYKADDGVLGCIGFCNKPGGSLLGEATSIQIFGMYPELPAGTFTPGTRYYQSHLYPGEIRALSVEEPALTQVIGFAITDTQLFFNPNLKY